MGVLALVLGFWLGLGSGVGVSGGWWCLAGGSRFLVGGWCGVWGAVPLRPLLNSRPHLLGGLWVLGSGRPSVGWWCLLVGGVLWVAVLFWWGGLVLWVACLAGCVLVGLFSTWGRGCCSCWLFRFGRVFAGGVPRLLAPWVVSLSGGCSQACCAVPVGRADLDGRALRRPPPSPPIVHDEPSWSPGSSGRTHTLKR